MFDVVNDVESYPVFLPWCRSSEILSEDETSMVARLELTGAGLKHSFTTRNILNSPDSIELELIEGPFTKLSGKWTFAQLGEDGCRVTMDLQFDFDTHLFNLVLAGVFKAAADRMVDAFCERADKLYVNP
jgi:ribosome-associated toxin RatA of RatAB toxin-antitoxin module